jgi:phosphatidylserine decarboxylase
LSPTDFREKAHHIPVAREGVPYILAVAFATLVTAVLGATILAVPLLVLTLFVWHFFRDPERVIAYSPRDVLSPADGRVIVVEKVEGTRFLQTPCMKISIFMSVFNVHVNRIPCSGAVQAIEYQKGAFLAANLARASVENEQNWTWIQAESGHDVVMTQVAGLIARRIICWPREGDRVEQGERFGMIRFGSRMDVYVPVNAEIRVSVGDRAYGGETVLCRLI